MLSRSLIVSAVPVGFAQFVPAFSRTPAIGTTAKPSSTSTTRQIMRYGSPRQTEVLHILVREPFDLKQFVKPDDWQRPGVIQVLKMNQILHVPTGLYVYQQMHSNFWRVDNARLAKFSLTSNDSCGNTYKEARRGGEIFTYQWHTYWDGMADGRENVTLPPNGFFYDELPLRVRTIDFSKPSGDFEIQLAPTIINSKKDNLVWKPAQVHFESTERAIYVTMQHDVGTDRFVLDRDFPYLLRKWDAADGSRLQLKRSLKVDYWNYQAWATASARFSIRCSSIRIEPFQGHGPSHDRHFAEAFAVIVAVVFGMVQRESDAPPVPAHIQHRQGTRPS